ncbi:hypothetical protein ACJX0J_018865 [Zea mays]
MDIIWINYLLFWILYKIAFGFGFITKNNNFLVYILLPYYTTRTCTVIMLVIHASFFFQGVAMQAVEYGRPHAYNVKIGIADEDKQAQPEYLFTKVKTFTIYKKFLLSDY